MTDARAERAALDLAFDTRRISRLVAGAAGVTGAAGVAGAAGAVRLPACRILDAKYLPGQGLLVLYQLGRTTVLGVSSFQGPQQELGRRASMLSTHRGVTPASDRGQHLLEAGMLVYCWPHDPALGTLPAVFGAHEVVRALERVLPDIQRVTRCTVTPVRYRPARRCTVRIQARVHHTELRTFYAKIYHDLGKAERAYATLRALAAAPALLSEQVVVPRPVAFLPDLALVLSEPVDGAGLEFLLGDRVNGVPSLVAAARALAALHRAEPMAAPPRTADFELDRLTRRAWRIREHDEALGGQMAHLTATLGTTMPPAGELAVVHGDCKPSQFLVDRARRVALLDFDGCRLADPAGDVGAFTASIRLGRVRASVRHQVRTLDTSLEQQFVGAYCAASGRGPVFRERVRWYEVLSLVRKAQRAFSRAPRSPVPAAILGVARSRLHEATGSRA